jgi:hypothetical protein
MIQRLQSPFLYPPLPLLACSNDLIESIQLSIILGILPICPRPWDLPSLFILIRHLHSATCIGLLGFSLLPLPFGLSFIVVLDLSLLNRDQFPFRFVSTQDPKLWYGIGILYDRYGSLDHAEEAFSSTLNMDPGQFLFLVIRVSV